MCGIAGVIEPGRGASSALRAMIQCVYHRGPDDSGVWTDESTGTGLAHARLSILDLSQAGRQPMQSSSGRFTVVFNGEIYNHPELREELARSGAAPQWRGHSDTETLLAAFEAWGVRESLIRTVGMFALGVWDRDTQSLMLARDRIGEKPIYYGWQGNTFLFGSELSSLKAHPSFAAEVDRNSVALLMRYGYIPAPFTIYKDVHKLTPGTLLTISRGERYSTAETFWSARSVIEHGIANPFKGTDEDAVDELESLLSRSVRGQMLSDVPLGAFLSGGVDSSLIVALMQRNSDRPVRTFTIGFAESTYNEAVHAKAVAQHLGTDHTELYVTPADALNVIPRLPSLYSEPFADSSQIPTSLVSELTRAHVTVSLSGDGGDELFAGYNRYVMTDALWNRLSSMPNGIRRGVAKILKSASPATWNRLLTPVQSFLPPSFPRGRIGDRLVKGAGVLAAQTPLELYKTLVSQWTDPTALVLRSLEPPTLLGDVEAHPETDVFVHAMMALDLLTYLPDDILVKVDRAAMATGLETRVPMLDHRIVEFAWQLPLSLKLRDGVSKWALREVLYRYVPKSLIERPKMGFGVPIGIWLRGPLRDWAESMLDESRLRSEGYFNSGLVNRKWTEHLSGSRDWQYQLWNVLVFQAWLAEQR